ncbi:MAG: type II secretion system protein [Candidatus Omnitrophica bacterium]|nr:type II secretion system protein [Candidatus Omnitrophota bacterium]
MRNNKSGFTLIELIMVVVILAILAVAALPKYFDLSNNAKTSAEQGAVGGVRAGIATFYANACAGGTCAYPAALDAANVAACAAGNPCFGNVMSQAVTSGWTKASATTWTGPAGTTYTYTANAGTFQ